MLRLMIGESKLKFCYRVDTRGGHILQTARNLFYFGGSLNPSCRISRDYSDGGKEPLVKSMKCPLDAFRIQTWCVFLSIILRVENGESQ